MVMVMSDDGDGDAMSDDGNGGLVTYRPIMPVTLHHHRNGLDTMHRDHLRYARDGHASDPSVSFARLGVYVQYSDDSALHTLV